MGEKKGSFLRVGIVGLGLIGGSIARGLKAENPAVFIGTIRMKGLDGKKALKAGCVDRVFPSLSSLLAEVDLLVLAAPLSAIIPLARQVAKTAKRRLIVIDVGSVKGAIAEAFEELSNGPVEFLATHPMAGSEKSGFEAASADLYTSAPWILVPHKKNSPKTLREVKKWVRLLGARPLQMKPDEHDAKAALISHLPGLISQALWEFVQAQDPASLKIAGPGFRSMTRLAHSNPQLRSEIARLNQKNINRLWKEWLRFLTKF